jgi:hypothetical protein
VAAMDAFRDLSVTRLAAVVPYPSRTQSENDQLSSRRCGPAPGWIRNRLLVVDAMFSFVGKDVIKLRHSDLPSS